LLNEDVPTDLHRRFEVDVGVHVPGDSVDFTSYQLTPPNTSHAFSGTGSTVRWALRARPSLVESYWEAASVTGAITLVELPGEDFPVVLVDGAPALWHFDGETFEEWEALDLTTARGAAYLGGKVLVVGDNGFLVKDIDSGELTFPVGLPDATDVTAIVAGTAYAYVACDTAASSFLYRFSYPSLILLGELSSSAVCLAEAAGIVAIGGDDGVVYSYTSSGGIELVHNTATDAIRSIIDLQGTTYVGTGGAGGIWRSEPEWVEDTDLGGGSIRALAEWNGALIAADGESGLLWRRTAAGWTSWHELDGVNIIYDLWANGDALWIATEHPGGARVYRLQVADPGMFQCGPNPPDLVAKLLRCSP
jgi:hypothetical protein